MYSFSFCFHEKCSIFLSILNDNFARLNILGCKFFLSGLWVYLATPYQPGLFLQHKQTNRQTKMLIDFWGFLYNQPFVLPLLILEFSVFRHLNYDMSEHRFFLCVFILFGILCASWTWRSVSYFLGLKSFHPQFLKVHFDPIFSYFPFWNTYYA